jgi:uncharacterized protein YjbI with pentapeptide repeats
MGAMWKHLAEKWTHRTRRGMLVTAPVGTAIVMAAIILIALEVFGLWRYLHPQTQTEKKDFAQAAATVAAGIVLLGQMLLAGLNLQVTRETANQKADSDREGQITERYTRAVEQLGSEAVAIRLGGIYALERIAKDSIRDHATIVELLTAYVREFAERVIDRPGMADADVQAALDVLGRREATNDNASDSRLHFHRTTFSRRVVFSGNFAGALFTGSTLNSVSFIAVNLRGTDFAVSHLNNTSFVNATMDGASFSSAVFHAVSFWWTDLGRTVGLTQSNINECSFYGECILPPGLHWPLNLSPVSPEKQIGPDLPEKK